MPKKCFKCFADLGQSPICPHCRFDNASYQPESHHLPPGIILHERYLIGKAMGEGGFGITYAGYDLKLERKVAIKEYFPSGAVWRDPSKSNNVNCFTTNNFAAMFTAGQQKCIREAQSLAKLDDIPAIVRIIDYFSENNTTYLIMEFVEGVTLKEYVLHLTNRMTLPEILTLLNPVIAALDRVHRRGFVHRDISPDNIMITYDGMAKLLDFGAVKAVNAGGNATENPIIKRGFSPLELYSTQGLIGPWTDVYSLAATFFYLLTCTVLDEPTDRLSRDTAPERLYGILPQPQVNAMLHALALQHEVRQRSVAAFIQELTAVQPTIPAPPPSAPTPRSNKRAIAIVIAAAAIIIITVIAIAANTGNKSTSSDSKTSGTKATTTAPEETTKRKPEYPAESFVETPSVKYGSSYDYVNNGVRVHLPENFKSKRQSNAYYDAIFSDGDPYANDTELICLSFSDIDQSIVNDDDDMPLAAAYLKKENFKTENFENKTRSEMYQMEFGGQVWFCYDYIGSSFYTCAITLYNYRIVEIMSYSLSDLDHARELLYTSIETIK